MQSPFIQMLFNFSQQCFCRPFTKPIPKYFMFSDTNANGTAILFAFSLGFIAGVKKHS